jgi:hypothetical protein
MGKVPEQMAFDLLLLPQREPDVAQQAHFVEVAQKFKPRVLLGPDDVDMRRKVIVGIDRHAPTLEGGENRGQASA